ncbi:F-box protein, partial [Striga asiatica]
MSLKLLAHAKTKFNSFLKLCSTSIIKDESKFMVAQLPLSWEVGKELVHYSIISIKDKFPKLEKHLKYPMARDLDLPSSICNGLLLILLPGSYDINTGKTKKPPGEALLNPTTGEFKILPPPPSNFDPRLLELNDDKREHYQPNPAVMAELYSLRSNSWKQVSVVHPLRIPRHSGVHVNGTYYWLNLSDPRFIVSFDFATEKFASSVIPAPPSDKLTGIKAYLDNIELVEYCGLLGAMVISGHDTWPRSLENMRSLEIWVWDGSWSLVSTLTVPLFVGLWTLLGTDKLIFLDSNCNPMCFDCATGELKKIQSLPACMRMHIFPFVESYVPLN